MFSVFAAAQVNTIDDPKVGLVLSGGGAKGLAHIGVLKVLEEAGVRIDYIGGTSMGAIIGGLYASGYSAKQLDSLFRNTDFTTLIQDNIPRSAKTFYEKEESEKYALTLPFDKFQIAFPSSLSKGQNVYNLLSRLTAHVDSISDFSKLPIPFFCVATNIESGKEVMLEKGYLPRAITASGALPSLFSPVEIDGKILIDGGVVNNYPVNEVKAKGMDIIIGVDVQDSLKDRKNLKSALEVLVQINNYRTINDMIKKRGKTDVYIHPIIDNFSVVGFDSSKEIVQSGEDAAKLNFEILKEIGDRQKDKPQASIKFDERTEMYIKEVRIEGISNYSRSYVLGKLKLRTPGMTTYSEFNEGINNLSATGNFQDINYRLEKNAENSYNIVFNLRENNSRMLLRIGAHYDDLYKTAALLNVTRKRLFTNNDIASLDFAVGDNIRYNFKYYIDKGFYWSIGFNSSYNFFDKNVPINFAFSDSQEQLNNQINKINLQYSDFTNQIYAETLFQRVFLLGLGAEHKYLRYLSESIGIDENNLPRTVFESTNYYSAFGYLKYDSFDNSFFPNEGIFFNGDFHLYLLANGRNKDFDQFSIGKAHIGYAKSFGSKISAVIESEGGFKIGGNNTSSLDFFVGGFGYERLNNITPFYGYEALSLRGDTYLKAAITLDYEFLRKNHINIAANIANVGDDLFTDGKWIDGVDYSGYAIGYGLETFLGPMELKYSISPERDTGEWFVSIGYRF